MADLRAAGRSRLRAASPATTLGDYIHNARLNYYVTNIGSGGVQMVSTHPINTRNGFGGGFIGDYTDLSVGSDNVFHAFWTDTNNKQNGRLVLRLRVRADRDQPGGRGDRFGVVLDPRGSTVARRDRSSDRSLPRGAQDPGQQRRA